MEEVAEQNAIDAGMGALVFPSHMSCQVSVSFSFLSVRVMRHNLLSSRRLRVM